MCVHVAWGGRCGVTVGGVVDSMWQSIVVVVVVVITQQACAVNAAAR